jgi:hypothetical protein
MANSSFFRVLESDPGVGWKLLQWTDLQDSKSEVPHNHAAV